MGRNKKYGTGKKGIMAMVLIFALCVMANTVFADDAKAKRGIVLQGKMLKAMFHGKYKELKRGELYGYGWLDGHRVFVAYQQEGYSEAVVDAEIFDLRKSRVFELGTIVEAHGETNFDVNMNTSEVVFNAFGEQTADGLLPNVIKLMVFASNGSAYKIVTIKENINCKNVLWVDDNTIGATLNDGHETFVTISVPRQNLNLQLKGVGSK